MKWLKSLYMSVNGYRRKKPNEFLCLCNDSYDEYILLVNNLQKTDVVK